VVGKGGGGERSMLKVINPKEGVKKRGCKGNKTKKGLHAEQ